MTGEQLLHGLWAILPEIILLLLGILVIMLDLAKRGQVQARTYGYVTIAGALAALGVIVYQMITQQPVPALAFAGMVLVDLVVQMFRMMFVVVLILAVPAPGSRLPAPDPRNPPILDHHIHVDDAPLRVHREDAGAVQQQGVHRCGHSSP